MTDKIERLEAHVATLQAAIRELIKAHPRPHMVARAVEMEIDDLIDQSLHTTRSEEFLAALRQAQTALSPPLPPVPEA